MQTLHMNVGVWRAYQCNVHEEAILNVELRVLRRGVFAKKTERTVNKVL